MLITYIRINSVVRKSQTKRQNCLVVNWNSCEIELFIIIHRKNSSKNFNLKIQSLSGIKIQHQLISVELRTDLV